MSASKREPGTMRVTMRLRRLIPVIALLACVGCNHTSDDSQPLPPERRAAVESSVRSFVDAVAHDVTEQGPEAWQKHFADDPAFFMAVDGRLVFPDRQAATQGIHAFSRITKRVELRWGNDLRIDPLTPTLALVASSYWEVQTGTDGHQLTENGFFTGVAEYQNGRWQFRNAHWSDVVPAPKAP